MTQERKIYLQQYYEKNKKKFQRYFKDKYVLEKRKRLTYQHKYYKINREDILVKNKIKSLAFRGHAYSIYSAIKKYAKQWKLPCCTFEDFYDNWTFNDPQYQTLYDTWVESEYNEYLSPVVMRQVKKNGYVPENLKWDVKKNYSWWSEDSTIFKEVSKRLEEQQKERNVRSKEWRKKVRADFKAKQRKNK